MNELKVKGLVIRAVNLKESDRLLTIYTAEAGVITASARGARVFKSKLFASTAYLTYSSFVLVKWGEYYRVSEAEIIESFYGVRENIERLALAAYISEVICDVSTAEAEKDLLRLTLNSLYAISEGLYPESKIKAAFEIRAAAILGFMPDVLACSVCGERAGEFYFEIMQGCLTCYSCNEKRRKAHTSEENPHESHVVSLISEAAKNALEYCIYSPLEKLFSFKIPDEDMALFCKATEEYFVNQLERSYKSLDFYNEVKK